MFQSKRAAKKTTTATQETVTLGPQVREGELVFGVAHIFASFNDTFVHVTDLSGRETIVRVTGTYPYALLPRTSLHLVCCRMLKSSILQKASWRERHAVCHLSIITEQLCACIGDNDS
jgi:hypothetical protein